MWTVIDNANEHARLGDIIGKPDILLDHVDRVLVTDSYMYHQRKAYAFRVTEGCHDIGRSLGLIRTLYIRPTVIYRNEQQPVVEAAAAPVEQEQAGPHPAMWYQITDPDGLLHKGDVIVGKSYNGAITDDILDGGGSMVVNGLEGQRYESHQDMYTLWRRVSGLTPKYQPPLAEPDKITYEEWCRRKGKGRVIDLSAAPERAQWVQIMDADPVLERGDIVMHSESTPECVEEFNAGLRMGGFCVTGWAGRRFNTNCIPQRDTLWRKLKGPYVRARLPGNAHFSAPLPLP